MDEQVHSEAIGTRKLTAILCADVHGYSRLMGSDEEDTLRRLTACREVLFRLIREHNGRVANTAGDAVLADFPDARDAVTGAVEIQDALSELNSKVNPERQMYFRIGINHGHVFERQGDLFGDGVNVAARIQSLADPGGILMSSSAYLQLEHGLDFQVEFAGEHKLKNIANPVPVYRVVSKAAPATVIALASGERELVEPSVTIGVMPFGNLSEDAEQAYFCDGLTEDLTTALAAIPDLRVVARNTMFGFRGTSPDIRQLGRDLDATHIVEGSVRKSGNGIRINAQLIETTSGNHLWAMRYDKELADLFEIQDDIVRNIVTELDVRLIHGELARAWRASTGNPEAYDLFMRAGHAASTINPLSWGNAIASLDRALALDPTFVSALTRKSWILAYQGRYGFVKDPLAVMAQAWAAIEEALRLDERSGEAHMGKGILLMLQGRAEQAEMEFELGISLGQAHAELYISYAAFCFMRRAYQKALTSVRRAKELAGFGITDVWVGMEVGALSALDRQEEAFALTARSVAVNPRSVNLWAMHANLCAYFGLQSEFGRARAKLVELQPDFDPELFFKAQGFVDETLVSKIVERFRQAGWK